MSEGDLALACASLLVDELARAGVAGACIAPGSRSTALALAFERESRIPVYVHLDERAAAFFALGRARTTGAPVAVVCTSGTAAANFFPAVIEASMARVPLIVLTADRPLELRDTGANQTIDQTRLYGSYVRWFFEPGVPALFEGAARAWRSTGARAVNAAIGPPAGPVHINCAFREPLSPEGQQIDLGPDAKGRAGQTPWETVVRADGKPAEADMQLFAGTIAATERGVLVAGGGAAGGEALAELAARAQWPLIAEAHSDARIPGAALTAGQMLLMDEVFAQAHRPDLVIQTGAAPTSRATQALVASAARLKVIDPDGWPADPARHATTTVRSDPRALAEALDARLPVNAETRWLTEWRDADKAARAAMDELLDGWDEPFEGRVARDVSAGLPDGAALVVASSMPVRDLDMYMAPRFGLRVFANRGVSGIDGFVSTTLGVASAGVPTYALTGDLSLLHDASGLLWSARRATQAVFVVLNNNGGGIFDLLPSATLPEHERLFVTPHDIDLRALAEAAGAQYTRVEDANALLPTVLMPNLQAGGRAGGVWIIDVQIDRARALEKRMAVREAVARALG